MIKLIERFFKKEPEFNYTIAEYMPIKVNKLKTDVSVTEFDLSRPTETDEMQIDKIYNRL